MSIPNVVIEVSGGNVVCVRSDGLVNSILVDHDNIKAGDAVPDLPPGVTWNEVERDVEYNSHWDEV